MPSLFLKVIPTGYDFLFSTNSTVKMSSLLAWRRAHIRKNKFHVSKTTVYTYRKEAFTNLISKEWSSHFKP